MQIESLFEGTQAPATGEIGVNYEFAPVELVKVVYKQRWGRGAASQAIMHIHVFYCRETGVFVASSSPGQFGVSWVEAVSSSKEEAVRLAVTGEANRTLHFKDEKEVGPWSGKILPPQYTRPMTGRYIEPAEKAADDAADKMLAASIPAKIAGIAARVGRGGWSFDCLR